MSAVAQLTKAIEAVAPIHGVASTRRIDFKDEATKQQRIDAQAIADAWDFSDAATETRTLDALKRQASAAIEQSKSEAVEIDKAVLGYLLAYVNQQFTAMANLLQARTVINQTQRDNFVNNLATRQQAIEAIKTRIEQGS